MSGTAALSAARKRRASNAQGPSIPTNNMQSSSFSSNHNSFQVPNNVQQYTHGRGMLPQNMTIYENIDLIKAQMVERLHIITTQSRTLPPEKLKMLQKQQEIQTQILKQKMLIAEEIEAEEANQGPHFPTNPYSEPAPVSQPVSTPPKLTADKLFAKANELLSTSKNFTNQHPSQHPHTPINAPVNVKKPQQTLMPTAKLTPFVSMVLANGAVPPPIVILKSHDEKIGEHDAVLNDLTNRMNYINNRVEQIERVNGANELQQKLVENSNQQDNTVEPNIGNDKSINNDNVTQPSEEEEESTLLMDEVIGDLLNSREFMQGVVDKIMTETNLADVILKIDPVIKDNQELRSLVHSQQQMLNQMNIMLLTFLNSQQDPVNNEYNTDTTNNDSNIINADYAEDVDANDVDANDVDANDVQSDTGVVVGLDANTNAYDANTNAYDSNGLYDNLNNGEIIDISNDLASTHTLDNNDNSVEIISDDNHNKPSDIDEVEVNTEDHFQEVTVDNSRITLLVQEIQT